MTKKCLKEEYSSRLEVEEALAKFNEGKEESEKLFYVSYKNTVTGKWMYVPCEREFFYQWRNMKRDESDELDLMTRCQVPAIRGGMKRCMECCETCPYGKTHRDGAPISLDSLTYTNSNGDSLQIEIEDTQSNVLDNLIYQERITAMWNAIHSLAPEEQLIIDLFSKGESDHAIAIRLGSKTSTIQYKRTSILKRLKESLKDFDN